MVRQFASYMMDVLWSCPQATEETCRTVEMYCGKQMHCGDVAEVFVGCTVERSYG